MSLQAVLFDMDGVLFDTQRVYAEAWVETARQMGYPLDMETYTTYILGHDVDHGEAEMHDEHECRGQHHPDVVRREERGRYFVGQGDARHQGHGERAEGPESKGSVAEHGGLQMGIGLDEEETGFAGPPRVGSPHPDGRFTRIVNQ